MAYYHPSDELLMTFAAGQQTNALGIMIACHIQSCHTCRTKISMYEQIGGELFGELNQVELSPQVRTTLLQRLDEPEIINTQVIADERIPAPLRRFVPKFYDQLAWKGFSSSIKEFPLPISDEHYTAKFYKISAGKELPVHTHKGNEFTLVMEGSFSDKAGDYHEGDFILADTQTVHQPKASNDCDCICFAVMDAPLKMTGLFGRMLNPFM
jgi:putative transcriptional regulator